MAETRVVPSGKVYRHMFDAQVHLSLSLHETRRRRVANEGYLSGDDPMSTDTGTHENPLRSHTEAQQCSAEVTVRNQLFSSTGLVRSEEQDDYEEIRGLPDNVVSAKTGSDIVERLTEKRQRDHMEAVAELQRDLTMLSVKFEPKFRKTGEDFLLKLTEYDEKVERLMQKTENAADLEACTHQDLCEIWSTISHESALRRKCIHDLDEVFLSYETERSSMISAILRKYTMKLEKISYVMPCDVHRLIDNEAMMINQALLANRRAVAKLHLNLTEKELQKEVLYHLRWEAKLQDWKEIKVIAAVSQFKEFMNRPEIQNPKAVQDALNTMHSSQQVYSEQRQSILEQIGNMTPPTCSKSLAVEWFSSLSLINEQIDRMHIDTMLKLRKTFEDAWQNCLLELERLKNAVSTYGFTSDDIQVMVNDELLPLIGKCQKQAEEHLAAMDKVFETSAKTADVISKSLYKFVHGAAQLWEVHNAGLQKREKQLQNLLDQIRYNYEQQSQKKEAHLDVLLDKLRQESTENALKAALEKALIFLEEIKKGYVTCYEKTVDTMKIYPAMVLEELYTYSSAVSQYFSVREVYSQDREELQMIYPSFNLGQTASINQLAMTEAEEPGNSFLEFETNETFSTANGNVYNCQGFVIQCEGEAGLNIVEVEPVLYPKSLVIELQKVVREGFFNHLEQRYQAVLDNTRVLMNAKTEELKSELNLRLHLHQHRAKRVEMDIHNVRATELVVHQDRVNRHCQGVLEALDDLRTNFNDQQVQQQTLNEDFRSKIFSMEETFITATKSDKLVKLCASLQTSLDEHSSVLQESQRQFRKNLELKFVGLREANAQLMKSFKLFSEGGNFSPKEVEIYQKRLQKIATRIDMADETLMKDMQGAESKCMEQAREIVSKSEEKFQCLTLDLMFLEKIQRALTNTQIKIKAEAMKSNMQKKRINSVMCELEEMLIAYNQPSLDRRVVTSDNISNLTSSLIEELRKRCQYLDCCLDPSMAVPLPEAPLQGAFAVAARPRFRKQEKVGSPDSLLQPSRMGVAFMDDAAVGVIRGLLRISKPQDVEEINPDVKARSPSAVTVPLEPNSPPGSGQMSGKCQNQSGQEILRIRSSESVSSSRVTSVQVKRFSRPNRFDKRFHVFGPKPEEQQGTVTFKGCITNILWEANDMVLQISEDYYKKKDRRPISRPQYIQDSFEQCAEELNKRLLGYHSQTEEYHRGCVQELQQQLKSIESVVCQIPEVLLTKLRDQHLEDLKGNLILIHKQFEKFQKQSEQKKKEHSSKLRVRLSHPACEEELNSLVTAEDNRQQELRKAIQNNRLELQSCIKKMADEFVAALATMTENLLFQLDSILSADEVQAVEPRQESITILLHQRQVETLQEEEDRPLLERGSRTWPGIHYFQTTAGHSVNQQRETATITTAKTTMGHLKAIEIRNALHQSYEQRVVEELAKVEKGGREQEVELLHWQEHWRHQIHTLSTLSSG